jgi:catechol 2,3-dioxygenase-like lactoylglutathione lyase family enzyme
VIVYTDPMYLEQVAIIVDDYDDAIQFFVEMLGFELLEDSPLSPTMAGRSDGSWFDRPTRARHSSSRRQTAIIKRGRWASSSPVASVSFSASTTSVPPTNACDEAASSS